MKKIIIVALSIILGSFGYIIADSAIENRVNNQETSCSVSQEEISSCSETIALSSKVPSSESDQTRDELQVNDYLTSEQIKRRYIVIECYDGSFMLKDISEDSGSDRTSVLTTTQIYCNTAAESSTEAYKTDGTNVSTTVNENILLGTNHCMDKNPRYTYDLRFAKSTAQIVSKAPQDNGSDDENRTEYGIKFVFEGETNTSLAGKKIHIKGFVHGYYDNHQYDVWSTVNEDGTFRIESIETFDYPEGYSPFGFNLSDIIFE